MRIFLLMLVCTMFTLGCDKSHWTQNIKKAHSFKEHRRIASIKDQSKKLKITRDAQIALINSDYYNGPVDGKSSVVLRKAIEHFQKCNGLVANGELDTKTRLKLREY